MKNVSYLYQTDFPIKKHYWKQNQNTTFPYQIFICNPYVIHTIQASSSVEEIHVSADPQIWLALDDKCSLISQEWYLLIHSINYKRHIWK